MNILPDGVTEHQLEHYVDEDKLQQLEDMAREAPEKAAILCDHALKHYVENRREAWLSMAKVVYFVKERELWRYHPAGFTSLRNWAEQPEVDIHSSDLADMCSVMMLAPQFEAGGYDLLQTIRDVGMKKIRPLIPTFRKAAKDGVLVEQCGTILDELHGSDMSGVIEMLNPKGGRVEFNPEVVCLDHGDGTFTISFPALDYDGLEFLSGKLKLRRWVDNTGRPIPAPIALPEMVA